MTQTIHAYAASKAGATLEPFAYQPGELAADEVEIQVESCGICHSDLSMLDNEWGSSIFPLVAGHEVVGRIVATGTQAKHVQVGDRVGLGWRAASCMHCGECMDGDHHLCGNGQATIEGRHGGFAQRVRCHWAWAIQLPEGLDALSAGPLFCGGVTVFNPIIMHNVQPTDRVGVVGIGGLGHMAIKFLRAWGCEVTAFTSSEAKMAEAQAMGAHHSVSSTDQAALKPLYRSLDFILVTANVPLPWHRYIAALKPHGKLHFVGAVLEPVPIPAFSLVGGQKTIAGSPIGSPATTRKMLDFCVRHNIRPQIETFPMSQINQALEHLRSGKAHYRIVLESDW